MRFGGVFMVLLMLSAGVANAKPDNWTVYYGAKKSWEEFSGYDVIVFDGFGHPEVRPLVARDKTVLAYLSLVEVEKRRPFYSKVKDKGLVLHGLGEDRAVVDVRNPEWMKLLIEDIIPLMVRRGFNGLMFDTVDTAEALESDDPARYRGMKEATAMTIRHIRMHYPYLRLMVNRGFAVLPRVERDVDMVLAESIFIDGRDGKTVPFPEAHYKDVLGILGDAQARNPAIQLYSLDYWDMEDTEGVRKIYEKQRASGLIPYVSTPDLQSVHAEP